MSNEPKQSAVREFLCFIGLHKWIQMGYFTKSCPYCYKTKEI